MRMGTAAAPRLKIERSEVAEAAFSSQVRVSLLGGFEVTCDSGVVRLPVGAHRLVALLCLRNRLTHRAYVAGTLWPDATESRAGASLRSLLWRIRRTAGLVEATRTHLRLASSVVTDVQDFVAASERVAHRSTDREDADFAEIARSDELLPGWCEEWVLIERERLRQVRLHALESLCEMLVATGNLGRAVEAGLAAVAVEPLRESAHRALIRADLADGNQADAIRHFGMYRQRLRDELGLKPTAQIEDLIRGLKHR
jgi:DNA-binding SARP family transcriptional activator